MIKNLTIGSKMGNFSSSDSGINSLIKQNESFKAEELSTISSEQLVYLLNNIIQSTTSDKQGNIRKIICNLKDPLKLQTAGTVLDYKSILDLLELANDQESKIQNVLPILFVGIKPAVFSEVLAHASPQQFEILRHDGITEPIQYQLIYHMQKLKNECENFYQEVTNFEESLKSLSLKEIKRNEIQQLESTIEKLALENKNKLQKINRALAIGWNSNRVDIIEKLNHLKELNIRTGILIGAKQEEGALPASGLYQVLEDRLNQTFLIAPESGDILLNDNDRAIDALIEFSVWYLQDYWLLGLLPTISNIEDLELSSTEFTENQRLKHREDLLNRVESNLSLLGLKTVKDLKQAKIYSKKALLEYIHSKQNLMKE